MLNKPKVSLLRNSGRAEQPNGTTLNTLLQGSLISAIYVLFPTTLKSYDMFFIYSIRGKVNQ